MIISHIRPFSYNKVKFNYQETRRRSHVYEKQKIRIKLDRFECNLLINGMIGFRNMLMVEGLPTEDIDELLLKLIDIYEK